MKAIDRPGVLEALRAIRASAAAAERANKEGGRYKMMSVRGEAHRLGHGDLIDDILAACVEGGFSYCLDHTVSATHFSPNDPKAVNDMVTDYPSQDVCIWGADQLRSRLDFDYRIRSAD